MQPGAHFYRCNDGTLAVEKTLLHNAQTPNTPAQALPSHPHVVWCHQHLWLRSWRCFLQQRRKRLCLEMAATAFPAHTHMFRQQPTRRHHYQCSRIGYPRCPIYDQNAANAPASAHPQWGGQHSCSQLERAWQHVLQQRNSINVSSSAYLPGPLNCLADNTSRIQSSRSHCIL